MQNLAAPAATELHVSSTCHLPIYQVDTEDTHINGQKCFLKEMKGGF